MQGEILMREKFLSAADIKYAFIGVLGVVAVKAKPECCSEQNRNPEKRLVERASVHDFALKTTIIEG